MGNKIFVQRTTDATANNLGAQTNLIIFGKTDRPSFERGSNPQFPTYLHN